MPLRNAQVQSLLLKGRANHCAHQIFILALHFREIYHSLQYELYKACFYTVCSVLKCVCEVTDAGTASAGIMLQICRNSFSVGRLNSLCLLSCHFYVTFLCHLLEDVAQLCMNYQYFFKL